MKCEKCKKQEATFFYEETINGKTRSYHLCRDCADELQAKGELHLPSQHDDPFSLFLPHQNFLESLFGNSEKSANKYCDKKCSGCGATWEELCSVGKALCPLCYQTFAEELRPTVRSIHGNVTHTGKAPARDRAAAEKKNLLASLRQKLSEAIKNEQYEEAATLRDEIRRTEQN